MQRTPMPSPTPEEVQRLRHKHNPIKASELFAKVVLLLLGSLVFAVGLEAFLVPNQIIDGGIVGVSIIISYLTETKLAIWLVLFNLPFIYFGYRQIGKTFAVVTLTAILLMSTFTIILHDINPFTDDLLLSTVFGGFLLGTGIGLISGQEGHSTERRFSMTMTRKRSSPSATFTTSVAVSSRRKTFTKHEIPYNRWTIIANGYRGFFMRTGPGPVHFVSLRITPHRPAQTRPRSAHSQRTPRR